MLNTMIFTDRIPADDADSLVYHGGSHHHISKAICEDKWYFGCAEKYEADGEGLQFPGEVEAIDEYFHLEYESATDVLSTQHVHGAIRKSHKDIYNSCWSISRDVAQKFACLHNDGVILSVKASALAASIKNVAEKWSNASQEARAKDIQSLSLGDPDGIPETGYGRILASAAFIDYLPSDYQHVSHEEDGRNTTFLRPIQRTMRLPESLNGKDLVSEKEFRLSLILSNSDGCRSRNPSGPGNVLTPMITQANTTSRHHGIWLHGLSIKAVEGYTITQSDY